MSLHTVPVTCTAYDQNGNPVAGAELTATLTHTEIYRGFVAPEVVTAEADHNGVVVVNLFPNALGVNGSMYRVTIRNPDTGKRFIDAMVMVPDSPCHLHQILDAVPPPPLDAAQQAVLYAQDAIAQATHQASISTQQATAAGMSATAASVSASRASLDRDAASSAAAMTHADAAATASDRLRVTTDAQTIADQTALIAIQAAQVADRTVAAEQSAALADDRAAAAAASALLAEDRAASFITHLGQLTEDLMRMQAIVVKHHGFN